MRLLEVRKADPAVVQPDPPCGVRGRLADLDAVAQDIVLAHETRVHARHDDVEEALLGQFLGDRRGIARIVGRRGVFPLRGLPLDVLVEVLALQLVALRKGLREASAAGAAARFAPLLGLRVARVLLVRSRSDVVARVGYGRGRRLGHADVVEGAPGRDAHVEVARNTDQHQAEQERADHASAKE
ncbi:MAG: hypothetical protein ACYTAF_17385 [Planctomycetota bacterium]